MSGGGIVQAQTGTVLLIPDDGGVGGPLYSAQIVNGVASTPRLLVSGTTTTIPTFSPDGKKIAYWKSGTAGGEIHVVWNDGTHDRTVATHGSASFWTQWMSWTNDDHLYWFESSDNLFRVDAAGGAVEVVFTKSSRISGTMRGGNVSRDGTRGGYMTMGSNNSWFPVIFMAGQPNSDVLTDSWGGDVTISPDGNYLTQSTGAGTYNGKNYPDMHLHFYVRAFNLSNPGNVYKNFDNPSGETNCDNIRFPSGSNNHVCFWCGSWGVTSSYHAYLVNIATGQMTRVATGYMPGDYWDGPLPNPNSDTTTFQFSQSAYSVAENGGTATITISRAGTIPASATVSYATNNGTATAGQDYTSASNTISFGSNEMSKTFTVAITNDATVESNETINLTLSNPTAGAQLGTQKTAVLTITDNDFGSGPFSLWTTPTPNNPADADNAALEVGLRFSSNVSGYVTGVRFYKGSTNTGTHVGHVWTQSGTLLGTVTFTGETATGWQQATFSSPIAITAGTVYVVSYHAPNGHYAADLNYFTAGGMDQGPLHAIEGVYAYGPSGTFPNATYNLTNYWVDVVCAPATGMKHAALTASATELEKIFIVTPDPIIENDMLAIYQAPGVADKKMLQGVDIHSLSGTLVRHLSPGTTPTFYRWNLKDQNNQTVPAGIYLIKARVNGRTIIKKINIINR